MFKRLLPLLALSVVSLALPALAGASKAPKLFVHDHDVRGTAGLETVKRKLESGFSVAIHGESLDMVELYPFFKELKIPVGLSAEENQRVEALYGHLRDAEDQRQALAAEPVNPSEVAESRVIPLILLHPSHGRVFADFHSLSIAGSDVTRLKSELRAYRQPDNISRHMEGFAKGLEQKVLPEAQEYASLQAGQMMTSIRHTQTHYGDFYFAGFWHYGKAAGRHITDYIIYNAMDTDPSFNHLIVVASAQVYTFPSLNPNGPPYVTRSYHGSLDNFFSSDTLIDQDPDTSMTINNGGNYSFIVGFPATVQFSYGWTGSSSTSMVGVGDKSNQYYYNQFTRQSNGGLSLNAFTVKYSGMYKCAGTILKLQYRHLFGVALDGTPSGYTWYGNTWYILEYDY
jgi:hypothetical protein